MPVMALILKDFTVAVSCALRLSAGRQPPSVNLEGGGEAEDDRRGTYQGDLGACRDRNRDGADSQSAGGHQTDFRREAQGAQA